MSLYGRQRETDYLDGLLVSGQAEFLAIYGRRRVGKTFLIREYLKSHLAFLMNSRGWPVTKRNSCPRSTTFGTPSSPGIGILS